jgi:hypothetical protein
MSLKQTKVSATVGPQSHSPWLCCITIQVSPLVPFDKSFKGMIMMPRPVNLQPLDRNSGWRAYPSTSTPPCGVGSAAFVLVEEFSQQPQRLHHAYQDPFANGKAFHEPTMSSGSSTHKLAQDDDGYTCLTGTIGIHGYQDLDHSQLDAKMRTVPYHAAVRLANRSNGAPLATIIEQGSYSTLNSHGSLPSVGGFPSISTTENASPARFFHRLSRNPNENALHQIHEGGSQEKDASTRNKAHPKPQSCGSLHPIHHTASPMKACSPIHPYCPPSQISETEHDPDGRPVEEFFRGVVQNVRAASRIRSRSSAASFIDAQEDRPGTTKSSPLNQLSASNHSNQWMHNNDQYQNCLLQTSSSSAASTPAAPRRPVRIHEKSVVNPFLPARALLPLSNTSLPTLEQEPDLEFVPHLLPLSAATRPTEPPLSVRCVPPEPRDVVCNAATAGAATLSKHSDGNASARDIFYGVTVTHKNASSLLEHNRAREASRNASFCSTMSTSYSETVLGIDLDLEHEFPHPVRRSSSPMPV